MSSALATLGQPNASSVKRLADLKRLREYSDLQRASFERFNREQEEIFLRALQESQDVPVSSPSDSHSDSTSI